MRLLYRKPLSLKDFAPDDIRFLLELAAELKRSKAVGNELPRLKGKNIVLIFEKPSTRTRCAFEVAVHDQGGHVTYLDAGGSQLGHKESLKDTARVLGRYYDGIEYRGFHQSVVEELARFANGLKLLEIVQGHVLTEPVYASAGRPKRGQQPDSYQYRIEGQAAIGA